MEYRYNFSFLPRWMNTNKITASELLDVMGTKDYATLRRWIKGDKMIKLDAMLSICNTYGIPLACFFVNKEMCINELPIPSIEYDDEVELSKEETNKKHGINPYITSKKDSILPSRWAKLYEDKLLKIEKGDASKEEIIKLTLESKYNNNITKLTEKYQNEVNKVKKEYKIEKERLNKQLNDKDLIISNLSKTLSNVTIPNKNTYNLPEENASSDMVSEDLK